VDPRALVQPLEARWQDVLDAVLHPMRQLTTKDVAKLGSKVAELSRAYNAGEAEGRRTKLPLEARIAFSFPRDVPKGAAAVRELVASRVLAMPADRPLRVMDLGAGVGAMTWGIVRALAASGATGRVEAVLADEDEEVLKAAGAIARAARSIVGASPIDVSVTTQVERLGSARPASAARTSLQDVVILGQVLSEIDPRSDESERIEAQSALVAHLLDTVVAPHGSLVIVEPALRERTRHLHAVRDRLLERGAARVFAPCLHGSACPMLALEGEWCHEDLAVDLPPWIAPLARAAGLRWQGLTFSYLVLRKEVGSSAVRLAPESGRVRFRSVSDLLRTKGKAELFICGEDGMRRRIRRLDRDEVHGTGVPFLDLRRGDIVTLSSAAPSVSDDVTRAPDAGMLERAASAPELGGQPVIDERGRVAAKTHVAIDVGAARK
jgi:ribosomal protein RSM22 (predicted rRNA methylase)